MNKCLHIFISFNIQLNYNIKSTYTVGIKPVIIWLNNVCSPQWLKKVIKGMNTWKRRENNRRKRKTRQRDNSTNKMKSVCVYVLCYPDNMCVCECECLRVWQHGWLTGLLRLEEMNERSGDVRQSWETHTPQSPSQPCDWIWIRDSHCAYEHEIKWDTFMIRSDPV